MNEQPIEKNWSSRMTYIFETIIDDFKGIERKIVKVEIAKEEPSRNNQPRFKSLWEEIY